MPPIRINDGIDLGTNAFDDRRVNLIRVALAACHRVIRMQMNDRGTAFGGGNPVGDNLFNGDRNGGLAVAPPGAIQRRFDPNLRNIVAHIEIPFSSPLARSMPTTIPEDFLRIAGRAQ